MLATNVNPIYGIIKIQSIKITSRKGISPKAFELKTYRQNDINTRYCCNGSFFHGTGQVLTSKNIIRIADFGLAREESSDKYTVNVGTDLYRPTEQRSTKYDFLGRNRSGS